MSQEHSGDLNKALFLYHNTDIPVCQILKQTGMSKATFYRNLDYLEEKRAKNRHREYNFNLNKFKIDSQDKFYWLGFISADGGIVNNSLSIELKDIDKNHLIKFNIFSENENPLTERINNQDVNCIKSVINSYELISYLKEYNIIPNKSLIFTIPEEKIPEQYIMDYLRGLIDGDGCIRINNSNQISLSFCSGNKKCIEQFAKLLKLDNSITSSKTDSTYRIQITGNSKALLLLDEIYKNSKPENRLDRKYDIYIKKRSEINE